MAKKICIVGGVAGGASAAARLRRLDETAEIHLFEKGEYVSFANCGLPYHIGGVIEEREMLLVQTVEGMAARFAIGVHNLTEVTSIDRAAKEITTRHLPSGTVTTYAYDVLILSPGAAPLRPPIPGLAEADNVFTLRNIPDTDAIKAYIDRQKPQEAVVIGGGFIGLEMAENFAHRGLQVTIVEAQDQVMAPLDPEMAAIVHTHLREKGVRLILGDGVKAFRDGGKAIDLASGTVLRADITLLSIGVRPENALAKEAGLSLGARGGILVNDYLQSVDDAAIYAIGDVIEIKDFVQGTPGMIPLAWPANRQGRLAADHICGREAHYRGSLGTSIAQVFDIAVGVTGNNEKLLKNLGRPYHAFHIYPNSHASYYPGASPLSIKVLFDPTDERILGAQCIGQDNVDKTIDLLAMAIKAELKVTDLADMEVAYAPPFNSAKAPINFIGYVAENILDGLNKPAPWDQVDELAAAGAYLLDISEEEEYILDHFPGAKNIPLGQLRSRIKEISTDQPVYLNCKVGLRGYIAGRILAQHGIEAINVDGGLQTYRMVRDQDQAAPLLKAVAPDLASGVQPPTGEACEGKELVINACGLQCPGPIMQLYKGMERLAPGDTLEIQVTDVGFMRDAKAWAEKQATPSSGRNKQAIPTPPNCKKAA